MEKTNNGSKKIIYLGIALFLVLVLAVAGLVIWRLRKDSDELDKVKNNFEKLQEEVNKTKDEAETSAKKQTEEVKEETTKKEEVVEVKKENVFESKSFPFTFEYAKNWSFEVQKGFLGDDEICLLSSSWKAEIDKLKAEEAATDAPPCLITMLYFPNQNVQKTQEDYLDRLDLTMEGVKELPDKKIGKYDVEIWRTLETIHELDVYFFNYDKGGVIIEVWTANSDNISVAEDIIETLE
jgi:hypothetical protein